MVEMKRNEGFTLVELLVVIAIIAILAGIIIPNVPGFIAKARMTRAFSEIKGIDLALTKMLTDANRQDFRSGFFDSFPVDTFANSVEVYRFVFYNLLKNGKNAESSLDWPAAVSINPDVKRRLGSSYMNLAADPWGQLYYFYTGPFRAIDPDSSDPVESGVVVPFRIYVPDLSVPGGPGPDRPVSYIVEDVVDPEDAASDPFDVGYPAPRDMTIYIWSAGGNLAMNQLGSPGYGGPAEEFGMDYIGGGDDINNWDNDTSWVGFYN
jgi:prepilin-type N-terminal cleavage/methylation domain-containing protein